MASQEKRADLIAAAKQFENVPWCEEYEKMISGMLYNPFVPPLDHGRFRARRLAHKFNNYFPDECENMDEVVYGKKHEGGVGGRTGILKQLLGSMGENVYFEPPLFVDYGCNISVGDGFYANANTIILDCSLVTIGDRVMFGPSVSIFGATHETSVSSRRAGVEYAREVSIGDDCWIGGNTVIVAGVSIGKGCTIGAGSTVTKDIPAWSVAVGTPARVIKKVEEVPDVEITGEKKAGEGVSV